MNTIAIHPKLWLVVVVAAHLVISAFHGRAHGGAHVPLSAAASLFVYVVILAGPLVGLILMWAAERPGAWLIAAALTGAFVFGVLNHFVLTGADHVGRVAPPWQALFATTAVLLALTEALGAVLALSLAIRRESTT